MTALAAETDARLVAFGDLLEGAQAMLDTRRGIICLAARLVAHAPGSMPYASPHPDKLMAAIADPSPGGAGAMEGLEAALDALDALARRAIAMGAGTFGTVEGIWLFAALAASTVRVAPVEARPALVGLYEAARQR